MELARALADMGGAARWSDLVSVGVRPGLFVLPQAAPDVVAARALGAQAGCLSACLHWELPLLDWPGPPHIVVGGERKVTAGMRRTVAGTVHRSERHNLRGLYASPLDAIDQAGWYTSPIGQVAMLDAAIRRGLIAREDTNALTVGPRRQREWLPITLTPVPSRSSSQ